jgi:branched-chain amino acid transport system substrate-binding protein
MRGLAGALGACALLVALAACGSDGDSSISPTPPRASPTPLAAMIEVRPGAPIRIGVSAPLTGDQAALGVDIGDAAELAVADFGGQVDGHPVEVVRVDDGCADPERAVEAARRLIAEAAIAGVIGPMCTTGVQAAGPLYERAGLIHVVATATRVELSEAGRRTFFRVAWRDDVQARIQARYAALGAGAKTAFVVDDGEPYGKGLADHFVGEFEAAGGRVVVRERIGRGTTDFSTLAREVRVAAPDVMVFQGVNPEGALIVRALRAELYGGLFMGPDGLLSVRDFLNVAQAAATDAIITGAVMPEAAFSERFFQRFNRQPATPFVLQAHDSTTALLRALDATGATDTSGSLAIDRERLRETLRTQAFAGLTGEVAFDENGDRRGESAGALGLTVYRVGMGQFVPVQ